MGDIWSIVKVLYFLQELSQLWWFICKVAGSAVELEEADTGVWRTNRASGKFPKVGWPVAHYMDIQCGMGLWSNCGSIQVRWCVWCI